MSNSPEYSKEYVRRNLDKIKAYQDHYAATHQEERRLNRLRYKKKKALEKLNS